VDRSRSAGLLNDGAGRHAALAISLQSGHYALVQVVSIRERWQSFRRQPLWTQCVLAVLFVVGGAFAAFALYAVIVIAIFGI
jgi:acetyl-CoA carboxylase beta subunit